jgi:peptide/nickel transport system substrate-binding protein
MMTGQGRRSARWLGVALGALLACGVLAQAAEAKDRFVVDLASEPSTLDPQQQWNPDSYYVYRNIFDNLVTRNDQGEIVPQVAVSWNYRSDSEIDFRIRDDVTFHDGRRLTPEDVVFSIRRITDPRFASPQLGQFNKIVAAEVVGTDTVRLRTNGPYPALLAQLVKLSIVPKHVVEAVGNDAFNLAPVGSGPYRFQQWQRGVAVTLARNDAYWGTKGPFPTAIFRAVPDAATRLADVQAGAADLVMSLDSDQVAQLQSSSRGQRLSVLTERVAYLRVNPNRAPFDNVALRQALALAIDKQGISEGILGGLDQPAAQLLTPAHFGYVADLPDLPYDPARARQIVAAAGPAAKAEVKLTAAPFFDQRVVQAVQQMLNEAGFNASIELVDTPTFLRRTQQGPQDSPLLAFSRNSCSCQDADGALSMLFHSGNSWTIVENRELDGWLDAASSTLDPAQRLENYRHVGAWIAENVPVVPLFQVVATYGAAKPLRWTPTPNESLFLNRMSWAE